MKDLKNPSLEEVLEYPSLDEVLKAYDIHHDIDKGCENCPYNELIECEHSMNEDLYKYVMLLRKENRELIDKMYRMEQSM